MVPRSLACLMLACLGPSCSGDGGGSSSPSDTGTEADAPATACNFPVSATTLGGVGADECWGVALAANGDTFLACFLTPPGASQTQGMVRRITPDGQVVWETAYDEGGSKQLFMVTEAEGLLWVGGLRWEPGAGLLDPSALLLRLQPGGVLLEGRLVWQTPGWDEIDGIHVQADAVWLSGFAQGDGGTQDVRVTRLDADLETVWETSWDAGGEQDAANGHVVVLDGRVYVAATVGASNLFYLDGDAALVAFDAATGDFLWSRVWGAPATRENGLGLASDGRALYLVGEGNPSGGFGNVLLGAWDTDGELLWQVEWGGVGADRARAIAVDAADGAIVVAANTDSQGAGGTDVALLAFDPATGAVLDEVLWGGDGDDTAHDLAIRDGRVVVAGDTSSWSAGGLDGFILFGCGLPFAAPGAPEDG